MGPDDIDDPYCGACARAQQDYAELENITEDLTAIVVRLARSLHKAAPDHERPKRHWTICIFY